MNILMTVIFSIIGLVVAFIVFSLIYAKVKNIAPAPKDSKQEIKTETYSKLYKVLRTLPMFSALVLRLETILIGSGYSKIESGNKSAKYVLGATIKALIVPTVGLLLVDNLFLLVSYLLSFFFGIFVCVLGVSYDLYVEDLDRLSSYFLKVKNDFTGKKSVLAALRESSRTSSIHTDTSNSLARILSGGNTTRDMTLYINNAPNKYLKQFASLCESIHKEGDVYDKEGNHLFELGLNVLLDELSNEYNFTKRQLYKVKFTALPSFVAFLVPYFCVLMVNRIDIGVTTVPLVKQPIFVLLIMVLWLWLVFGVSVRYISASKIKTEYDMGFMDKALYKNLLRFKPFSTVIDRLVPTHRLNKRSVSLTNKYGSMLKNAASPLTIKEFFSQKLFMSIVSFLIVILFLPIYTVYDKNLNFSDSYLSMKVQTEEDVLAYQQREFEYKIFKDIESGKIITTDASGNIIHKKPTEEEILSYIHKEAEFKKFLAEEDIVAYSSGLYNKIEKQHLPALRWYAPLFALIASIVMWFVPDMLVKSRAKEFKALVNNEVEGYYTVLSVVTKVPSSSVRSVIKDLARYTKLFKEEFNLCLVDFSKNRIGSLESLKLKVNNQHMTNIVDKLIEVENGATMSEIFSDLVSSRKKMLDKKIVDQEKFIEDKTMAMNRMGQSAVVGVIIIMMLIPMGIQMLPILEEAMEAMEMSETLSGGDN